MQNQDLFNRLENFINELNQTTSQKDKIQTLKKYNDHEDIKYLLSKIYNPLVKFHITSNRIKKSNSSQDSTNESVDLLNILSKLENREITGNEALRYVISYTNQLSENHKKIFYNIIDKNLKCRINAKLLNKAYGKNFVNLFEVARGYDFYEFELKVDFEKDDWYASRKLDGVRCVTIIDGNDIRFYSRSGLEFETLSSLKKDLEKNLDFNQIYKEFSGKLIIDGELCIVDSDGNENFQDVMKEIKRKNHTIQNPMYLVFDVLTFEEFFDNQYSNVPLHERLKRVSFDVLTNVKVIDQIKVRDNNHFEEMKNESIEKRWEGLIIRTPEYYGKKSNKLLKVKMFQDAEYKVQGMEVGNIRYVVNGKEVEEEMLSSVIINHKGNDVSVGSGFTIDQRRYYYENYDQILLKMVTVKYFCESIDKNGKVSLRFPIVKCIHGEKRDV